MKRTERRPRKPVKARWRWLPLLFKFFLAFCLVVIPLGIGFVHVVVTRLSADLPDVEALSKYETPQTTRVFSRDGQVIATLFVENRTTVPLDRMSPYLVKALLAVEDSRFYKHRGVDWWGAVRAGVANTLFGGIDQGASTLTMQLARNRFLTQDQTFARKIREMVLAHRIEQHYSKEKILEYYLNNVYFGSGAYGVAAASSLYFGRSPEKLSIAQAALIAGLVQAPSSLSPLLNPEGAKRRMKLVLGRMKATSILTDAQHQQALSEGEAFRFGHGGSTTTSATSDQLLKYPYFTTFVIAELSKRYPEDMLYRGGLQVHTTLDTDLQRLAEEELRLSMEELGPSQNAGNAALVLIENSTGCIRAMVGGTRWSESNQFNRAWQALRQPGSSFKIFVYAAALLQGMTPDTTVEDSPGTFGDWTPKNSDGKYLGKIQLRQALQESRNLVAARLIESVGAERVVEVARALGIVEPLTPHLALALGACEVSPLSMASAYSTVASGGVFHQPVAVTQVVARGGEQLTNNRSNPGKRILPADVSSMLIGMMMRVVQYGTGTTAAIDGVDVAGKTGTTDDSRDAWFVGFTPEYTLAVWVGNDDHSEMWGVYGGGIPAIVWQRVMLGVVRRGMNQPRFALQPDALAKSVKVCAESGHLALDSCPKVRYMPANGETTPTETCTVHGAPTPTETPESEEQEEHTEETPAPVEPTPGDLVTPLLPPEPTPAQTEEPSEEEQLAPPPEPIQAP